MDFTQILGLSAAALTTAANVPQMVKIIKTKTTKGISSLTYGILFIAGLLWITYGIMRDDIPVIISNSISVILCGIIWVIRLTAKKTDNEFQA